MPQIIFTSHLGGIAPQGASEFAGETVGDVLEQACAAHPGLRHYILDDQDRVRKHVIMFVDDRRLDNATALCSRVAANSEIYVLQALSGGGAGTGSYGNE
jgi:sulfur-carrier protein